MDFSVFPVSSTNIFPIANSTKGGQLFTEFNIRARESIATPQDVKYMIGPSYVHSKDDFWVQCQTDGAEIFDESEAQISKDTIEIAPGRGVINGHYVELLTPIVISLSEANYVAKSKQSEGQVPLTGELSVGIRILYSTEATMAGCMEAENNDTMMYSGVKIVILPRDIFKLPQDVPDEPDKVTAHIKLADFTYINSIVTNLKNNYPSKCHVMSIDRISGVSETGESNTLGINGLKKEKFYTMSGRGSNENGEATKPTWCDSTDSLMIWDSNPSISTSTSKPLTSREAEFKLDTLTGETALVVPHKQPDGFLCDISSGSYTYYPDKVIKLPKADFNKNTGGTVTPEYTKQIKDVASKLSDIYHMPGGKQVGYLPELDFTIEPMSGSMLRSLPPIQSVWQAGDYILVSQDHTVSDSGNSTRACSTLYSIIPGKVRKIHASDATDSYTSAQKNYNFILNNVDAAKDALSAAESDKSDAIKLVEDAYNSLLAGFEIKTLSEEATNEVKDVHNALYTDVTDTDNVIQYKSTSSLVNELGNSVSEVESKSDEIKTIVTDLEYDKDETKDETITKAEELAEASSTLQNDVAKVRDNLTGNSEGLVNFELTQAIQATEAVTAEVEGLVGENSIFDEISPSKIYVTDAASNLVIDLGALVEQVKLHKDALLSNSRHMYTALVNTVMNYVEYYERWLACSEEYKKWQNQLNGADSSLNGLKSATTALYEALGKLAVSLAPSGVELGVEEITYDPANWQDPSGKYSTFEDYASSEIWKIGDNGDYRGVVGSDYFTVRYINELGQTINYYYLVSEAGSPEYSDPVILTREISLAETNVIGGFLNVDDNYLDAGYVFRDDNGHLRLLDYNLLRSGTLAYQLGENFSTSSGIDGSEIQSQLDEYVNMRVAFPNANHIADTNSYGSDPNIIEINLNLTECKDGTESIDLYAIDCRFNTSIYLTILGNANSNTTINIIDCQKIRINNNISGTPVINVIRSNVYYDPAVLNYIKTARSVPSTNTTIQPLVRDISLWYERFEDTQPNLFVDNMTVTETDANIVAEHESFWDDELSPNDTHLMYGLRSITFSKDATIVGCEMYVKNDSTTNIRGQGRSLITSNFTLPQGGGLSYPSACLTRPLKITGTFVSAYVPGGSSVCNMIDTKFTAISQAYSPYDNGITSGKVTFVIDTYIMDNISAESEKYVSECLDAQFHIFKGGAL